MAQLCFDPQNEQQVKNKENEFNIVFHMDMYKWIIPNEYGDESSVQQDLNSGRHEAYQGQGRDSYHL